MDVSLEYVYTFVHSAQSSVETHSHNCYEICYYLQGQGQTCIAGRSCGYYPMKYAVYEPATPHNEVHISPVRVACLAFHFPKTDGIQFKNGLYYDASGSILRKVEQIREEMAQKKPFYSSQIRLLISEIIIQHSRCQNDTQTSRNDEIQRICTLLDENFASCLSIEEICLSSGYSYHHFRHIFKEAVGVSPQKYLIQKRLEHARDMLRHSDMSITAVAQTSGFGTSSQFSSIFRKYNGLTPTAYRSSP